MVLPASKNASVWLTAVVITFVVAPLAEVSSARAAYQQKF